MTISISQENPGLFFNRLSNEFKMYCFSDVFLHLFRAQWQFTEVRCVLIEYSVVCNYIEQFSFSPFLISLF